MLLVPLAAIPAQQFGITLNNQNCTLSVYQKSTGVYFDLLANGGPITRAVRCLNRALLCEDRQYLGFVGDFVFIDTQGTADPDYTGLGSRFLLIYLDATDLALRPAGI